MPFSPFLRTRVRALFLLQVLSVTALLSAPLIAQNAHYVSPDGDDGNDGNTLETAWRTLTHSLAAIEAGDTLFLADGLYRENDVTLLQKIGTADQPTVVKAINQWGPKIESTAKYNTIFEVRDCEHVVIDGIEVFNLEDRPYEDWNSGISIWHSNHVVVQNCYAHDCGCGGFGGRESDYMTFRRNVARDNAKTNPYNCSGISIYQPIQKDDAPGAHIIIQENVCFENECRLPFTPGGFDRPTDGNGIILDDFNWTQNNDRNIPAFTALTVVENNLCFNNGGSGAKAFEVANAVFRNNTTAYNNYVVSQFSDNVGDLAAEFVTGRMEFYNNIAVQAFDQPGYAFNYENLRGSQCVFSNNLVVGDTRFRGPNEQANTIRTNFDNQSFPRFARIVPDDFVFTSVDDFRQFFAVRPGSPALSAGNAELAPPIDLTGRERPLEGNVDLGAFEGTEAGSGPLAPDRVKDFRVASTLLPITIDGQREALYTNDLVRLNRPVAGDPAPNDLSADFTVSWDDSGLYLYFDVRDNQLRPDGDGIELFIDPDNSRDSTFDGVNDLHYVIPWNAREVTERSFGATDGIELRQRSLFTSYSVEVRFPWATLGIESGPERSFGFDLYINDIDAAGGSVDRLSWQSRTNAAQTDPRLWGTLTLAQAEVPPSITGTGKAIAVDGTREAEWATSPAWTLANSTERAPNDSADVAATWSARWHPDYLYLLIAVTDDDVIADDDRQYYHDDGVEVLLDLGNEKGEDLDGNDFRFYVEYGDTPVVADRGGSAVAGAQVAIGRSDTGYTVELGIPWAALDFSPTAGRQIGIDVIVNDDDRGGFRDHRLAWAGTTTADEDSPATWGTVFLADVLTGLAPTSRPTLSLGVYPNPTTGQLTLELPAGRLFQVAITDGNGRLVYHRSEYRAGTPVALDFLPDGTYFLSARGDDERYRARVVVQH